MSSINVGARGIDGIAKLDERLVILLDLDRVLAQTDRRALETVA